MHKNAFFFSAAIACSLVLGACAAPTSDVTSDDEVSSADEALLGASNQYFIARPDLRRCAAPLCGGVFVKRANATKTVCLDGKAKAECYVSSVDYGTIFRGNGRKQADVDAKFRNTKAILRGSFVAANDAFGTAKLAATEAWEGRDGVAPAAGAKIAHVINTGIVCITTPCPSLSWQQVNLATTPVTFDGLAFAKRFSQADQVEAYQALANGTDGILTAGSIPAPKASGKRAPIMHDVQQFYTRVDSATQGPQACGSRGLPQCGADEFCAFPAGSQCGAADGGGVCTKKAEACIDLYQPVCGCDGQTYGNGCQASSAGVSVDHDGECARPQAQLGEACGGLLGVQCAGELFCLYADDAMCGAADQMGKCAEKTVICPMYFHQVCGCDGQTYGNSCVAKSHGTSVAADGPCAN